MNVKEFANKVAKEFMETNDAWRAYCCKMAWKLCHYDLSLAKRVYSGELEI